MSNPISASAPALPSAQILAFPSERAVPAFDLSYEGWQRDFIALCVSHQFVGVDDAHLDRAIGDMVQERASSVERMVRENGETLQHLRSALAFLAAMDQRIGASAARILSQRGC